MKVINGVQCRTRTESLKHIIKQAEAGKISTGKGDSGRFCLYEYPSGNNCAVGSLFSEAQLADIQRRELNEMSIDHVAHHIGEKNLKAVTGLTLKELEELQRVHDAKVQEQGANTARKAVIECAKSML